MTDDDIRKLILTKLTDVKLVMLSPKSVKIVRWLKDSPKTSVHLANKLNININTASNRLKQLHAQGYLKRIEGKSSFDVL